MLGIYLGRSFYITTTPRFVIVANNYYQLNSVEIVAKISILSQSIQSTEPPAYKAFNSTNSRVELIDLQPWGREYRFKYIQIDVGLDTIGYCFYFNYLNLLIPVVLAYKNYNYLFNYR